MSVLESGKLPLKPVHFIPQCLDLERCHSTSLSTCSWCLNCFHYFPLQWQNITRHHKTWEDTSPCEPSKSFQVSTKSSLDVEAASPDRWGGLSGPASGPSGPGWLMAVSLSPETLNWHCPPWGGTVLGPRYDRKAPRQTWDVWASVPQSLFILIWDGKLDCRCN